MSCPHGLTKREAAAFSAMQHFGCPMPDVRNDKNASNWVARNAVIAIKIGADALFDEMEKDDE